ncbi:MAG: ABC transporter ATP-binding protein [Planctomycetes bacterium]|nr:ABC transporter ATP-binding protein [Planctomycetota bacterium]
MALAGEVIDLHKHYHLKGGVVVKALHGVSMQFPQGDFVAIMGSSGSGKSTLLNLLGALDRPTSGEYILGGHRVSELSDDDLSHIRNHLIGFVFQSFNLIPQYTVLENVQIPLHYRRGRPTLSARDIARCIDLCEQVGLGERMEHRPFQLSGGQQQRVAIARALANDPEIILADEPTGNLDSKTGEEIMGMLRKLNSEGRTILMVTHEPDVAAQAKRRIVMKDGLIASQEVSRS